MIYYIIIVTLLTATTDQRRPPRTVHFLIKTQNDFTRDIDTDIIYIILY